MKNLFVLTLLIIFLLLPRSLHAQFRDYKDGRIAMSMDGNSAPDYAHKWPTGDPDDWGAEPASLAIIAKLELQDKLVHFSYNNFIDAPAGPDAENQMKIGADGAIERWGYNRAVFFDITTNLEGALEQLKNEMARSSKRDPLYFIHAGLSEFFYQALVRVVDEGWGDALNHVYVVSHSEFNENHLRRKSHHNFSDAMAYSNYRLNYQKIKDQNGKWDPNILWNSGEDFSPWYWMRDHKDPDVQWIYERMRVHTGGVADISDAGMLYWLFTGDEDGNPEKFKVFIGDGILKNYGTLDAHVDASGNPMEKQRLIILADMGNEPDKIQQMIHMITCSNEFDIEGLIAVTGKYIRPGSNLGEYNWVTHPELFHEIIDAYALVVENLKKHAEGWPEPAALKKLVAAGQKGYGIADVGRGSSSEGSELIIEAVSGEDPRPVWVVVNAGSNTLAQALVDYKASHTKDEMDAFVAKLRVFENGAQ
ncbi:MAG: DUF1593 domain-containing protein, partial [Bacteroides sp.]|nr:DUF1593 domain-containing protein [Bacteroides sp.]